MQVYIAATTGSLQLPILTIDPQSPSPGTIWFSSFSTGSIKFAVTSGSVVITRTFVAV